MFRMTRGIWFWLGAGACLGASSACSSGSVGGTSAAATGGNPSGAAGSGQGGEAGSGGQSPGQGGEAGVGGEPAATGGAGEPGGSAGAAGTAGATACRSVPEAAQEQVDAFVASTASYLAQFCSSQAALPCYPGDEQCLSTWDADFMQVDIEAGCVREQTAWQTCAASAYTADQFTCGDAGAVQGPPDPCPTESAAWLVCQFAVDTIWPLAEQVCTFQAGLPCYANTYGTMDAFRCAYAKYVAVSETPNISQYSNLGCQDAVQRLYMCLAGLTQDDFECRQVGATEIPAVKSGFCETEQANLDLCAC